MHTRTHARLCGLALSHNHTSTGQLLFYEENTIFASEEVSIGIPVLRNVADARNTTTMTMLTSMSIIVAMTTVMKKSLLFVLCNNKIDGKHRDNGDGESGDFDYAKNYDNDDNTVTNMVVIIVI